MQKDQLIQLLRKLQFTASFPDQMLERLATTAAVRKFLPHDILFREKSENDQLMIICSGRVSLSLTVPEHGIVEVLQLGPGELIAWSALLGGRMTTTATAVEETTLVALPATEVLGTCEKNHSFGYWLMRRVAGSLAGRLTDTRTQLVDLLTFEQAIGLSDTKRPTNRVNAHAARAPGPIKPHST